VTTPSITVLHVVNGEVQWTMPLYDQDAVEQIIYERLQLFQGEWWADIADGLPLWQSIIGKGSSAEAQNQMAAIIGNRIMATPYVISLSNVVITFNPLSRQFTYSVRVQTQFGEIPIMNYPVPGGSI
jgi:hypothetical protein